MAYGKRKAENGHDKGRCPHHFIVPHAFYQPFCLGDARVRWTEVKTNYRNPPTPS
jgi:hypothetical protein